MGAVWITLKGGGTEKRGGETKVLKRVGKLGEGVGDLKGRGPGTPTYKLWFKKRNLIVKLDLLKPGLLNYGISQGSILGSILIIVIMLIMVLYFI